MMFIDYTSPGFEIGDVIKIKRKSQPYKILKIIEEENCQYFYLVRPVYDLIISEQQITHLLNNK